MRSRTMRSALRAAVACALGASATLALAERAKPGAGTRPAPGAKAPDCPRASYKGDPVCFGEDGRNLPTPSARAVRREAPDDVRLNDEISVSGADPKAMSRRPVYLNLPDPRPRKPEVGGGATMNYRF